MVLIVTREMIDHDLNRDASVGLLIGVNQYTGAVEDDDTSDNVDRLDGMQGEPIQEEPIQARDELPEDRFHQADIVSQHMIDTREKQRMEKVRCALNGLDCYNVAQSMRCYVLSLFS